MPLYQYAIQQGKQAQDVVRSAGSAIGTDVVRVLIDTDQADISGTPAAAHRKGEVLKAIDRIRQRIVMDQAF